MPAAATPMLKQYQRIKSQHKDCILFFRLGDFYEMFYEDAHVASPILDLVLTSRGKGTVNHVPMCGVPYHSAENYIAKLIKAGKKVAICEQVEDPASAQGIVRRDVIRVITSGTYLDENSADPRYLLCLAPFKNKIGIAFIDPACGTIQTGQFESSKQAVELIAKLPVYECVYPLGEEERIKEFTKHPLLASKGIVFSAHEDWCFASDIAKKTLCEHFKVHNLKGYGIDELALGISAAGALLEYLRQMNKQPLMHIDKISLYSDNDYAFISPAAVYGLELATVFKTINHTNCSMGKRKLHTWLYHPLKSPAAILQRQAAVTLLRGSESRSKTLKKMLSAVPDIEKSISKLSCGYTHARDILNIRNALDLIPELNTILVPLKEKNRLFTLDDIPLLRQLLDKAVNPEMPLSNSEGKTIKRGFNAELDELLDIQENGRKWLAGYQKKEIERTSINTLKVGFNKVFGYYIEVTKANTKSVPEDYIRKQTLVNGERYITPELKEYEEKILTARDKILKVETRILKHLQEEILEGSVALHQFCESVATIDALVSLSTLSLLAGYTAPEVSDKTQITIKDGRHPVVETALMESFIPNDTTLNCEDEALIILTGPNMAGKSTYIRQIAVLVILAQMGSYIPASSASIGIVDKIFTRIGAHDDIAKGQSTFMVEMTEAADIVNNMTPRSLVILDEIGRGTSTYDGLSLAWALAEHFAQAKVRTLFATHFHELTVLADEHTSVKNYNVAVKEWKDEIIFLHKIVPGRTDDSYGIYVAKLAGVPQRIISRSKTILTQLELQSNLKERSGGKSSREAQISFFSHNNSALLDQIKSTLDAMDVNRLTPLEALNEIQKMKEKIKNEQS